MTKLLNSELSRTVVSVVGALMLSTTFVVAAVGPAKAAAPAAAATVVSAPLAC
jgi:hypothetical protein